MCIATKCFLTFNTKLILFKRPDAVSFLLLIIVCDQIVVNMVCVVWWYMMNPMIYEIENVMGNWICDTRHGFLNVLFSVKQAIYKGRHWTNSQNPLLMSPEVRENGESAKSKFQEIRVLILILLFFHRKPLLSQH